VFAFGEELSVEDWILGSASQVQRLWSRWLLELHRGEVRAV